MGDDRQMQWRTIGGAFTDRPRENRNDDDIKVMGGIAPDGAPMNRGLSPWPYLSNGGSNPRYLSFIHWLGVNLHRDD